MTYGCSCHFDRLSGRVALDIVKACFLPDSGRPGLLLQVPPGPGASTERLRSVC